MKYGLMTIIQKIIICSSSHISILAFSPFMKIKIIFGFIIFNYYCFCYLHLIISIFNKLQLISALYWITYTLTVLVCLFVCFNGLFFSLFSFYSLVTIYSFPANRTFNTAVTHQLLHC